MERRDIMPGPVAATRTVTALLSFAEICQRSKGYFVVMFNYCAEEDVLRNEQFNTTNDGESIKQTGSQTYKKGRKKQTKKKEKIKTEIEAIAKFRHLTRAQDELLSMTAFVVKNVWKANWRGNFSFFVFVLLNLNLFDISVCEELISRMKERESKVI